MTLRCTIEIVPHGDENQKSNICRLDISNQGQVRYLGFGHEVCGYSVKLFRYNNEAQQNMLKVPEWEFEIERSIEEHDRRDGAISLVQKATTLMENEL